MDEAVFLKTFVAEHTKQVEHAKQVEEAKTETKDSPEIRAPEVPLPGLSLPTWMRPIFAITIRENRFNNLLDRLGPLWRTHVVKWSGTVGLKIDRKNWLLKEKIRTHCRLTKGQLGCYDSHVRVWKDCLLSGRPTFIVEDDVNLRNDRVVVDSLELFWQRIKGIEFDFLYIGHNNKYTPKQYITHFVDDPNVVVPHGCQGLFAYLITPRGASFLLERATPYDQPIDVYVQHRLENDRNGLFRCYAMYPSPFYVVDVQSDTK